MKIDYTEFHKEKKDFLTKTDKSKKGNIDKGIRSLVQTINSKHDCYTTSSCSGRIVLLEKRSEKKQEASWLFSKHGKATSSEIKHALQKTGKHQVWFRQESCILHIRALNLVAAKKLLDAARISGFKRSGIVSIGKKTILELISTESIDALVAEKGRIVVSDDYIKSLVREANKKMDANEEKITKLCSLVGKL